MYYMSALMPAPESNRGPLICITDDRSLYKDLVASRQESGYRQETARFRSLEKAEAYIANTYGPTNYWQNSLGVHMYFCRRPK